MKRQLKSILITAMSMLLVCSIGNSQNSIAQKVDAMKSSFDQSVELKPFERMSSDDSRSPDISHIVGDAQLLSIKTVTLEQLNKSAPATINVDLPISEK